MIPGLFATADGECRFADLVQASIAPGNLSFPAPRAVLVATLPMLAGWRAADVVEGIQCARTGRRAAGVAEVRAWPVVPAGLPAAVRPQDLARWFDSPEGEAALLAAVERPTGPAPRCVLFPPVLGFVRTRELRARLEDAFGCPCAEVLATTPSVPGFRLQTGLDAGLRRLGVTVLTGTATGAGAGGLDLRVTLSDGTTRALTPRAVVLATGKFIGGGLTRDGRLRETVFGLPVSCGGRRVDDVHPARLTTERRGDAQPLLEAGVAADADMRPRIMDGGARPEGLFVAGAVVADWAYPERGCGLLVAGALAVRAADQALEFLGVRSHDAPGAVTAAGSASTAATVPAAGAPLAPSAPTPTAEPAR